MITPTAAAVLYDLRVGLGVTRRIARERHGLNARQLEWVLSELRGAEGVYINRIKGVKGEWVYVAHDNPLFKNLEDGSK